MKGVVCNSHDKRESTHALDYVVVILIGLGCIPFVAGNVLMLCNLGYPPLRQKNIDLTVASSIGGLIWLLTTIVINHHFDINEVFVGRFLCPIWSFWLQGALGFALWLNCLNAHLYALHRILVQRRKNFKYRLLPLLLMQVPIIGFCIAGTRAHASRGNKNEPKECTLDSVWADVYSLIPLLYFFLFLSLAFRLRKVRAHYNEFGMIRKGGVIALFLYILSLVYLGTSGNKEVVGRCFLTFSVASAVFYYFWARNGVVLFAVLFHKAAYLEQWNGALASNEVVKDELEDMNRRASTYKERVKELEEEIANLDHEYRSIHQQVEKLRPLQPSFTGRFAAMETTKD